MTTYKMLHSLIEKGEASPFGKIYLHCLVVKAKKEKRNLKVTFSLTPIKQGNK